MLSLKALPFYHIRKFLSSVFQNFFEVLFACPSWGSLVNRSYGCPLIISHFDLLCQAFFVSFFKIFWRSVSHRSARYSNGLLSFDSLTTISYLLLNVNCFSSLFLSFLKKLWRFSAIWPVERLFGAALLRQPDYNTIQSFKSQRFCDTFFKFFWLFGRIWQPSYILRDHENNTPIYSGTFSPLSRRLGELFVRFPPFRLPFTPFPSEKQAEKPPSHADREVLRERRAKKRGRQPANRRRQIVNSRGKP